MRGFGDYTDDDTASAIKARDWKDATDLVTEPPILIDRSAFNQGVNAQYDTHISDDPVTPSLVARGPHAVATASHRIANTLRVGSGVGERGDGTDNLVTAIVMRQREGKPGAGKGPLLSEDKSLTLAAAGNDQTLFVEPIAIPIHDQATRFSGKRGNKEDGKGNGLGIGQEGDPMNTLTQGDRHAVIQYDGYNQRAHQDDVALTVRIGRDSSDCIAQPTEPIHSFDTQFGSNANVFNNQTPPLKASQASPSVVEPTMSVRRLTPLECERLMGWPDDWTAGQADTHRYKQCGNGVASPVAQWIGEQILNIPQ